MSSSVATTREIELRPGVTIALTDAGQGPAALVLHGGGGPATVAPIAAHLAGSMRVLTPTHPGWNGTHRPAAIASIPSLAALYRELLAHEGLRDVIVIGSSIGGWIACEMATGAAPDVIRGLVLVDSLGIDVPGETITDFFTLTPRGIADHSFHDSDRFYPGLANMSDDEQRVFQENMVSLRLFAGDPYMHDPTLRSRLADVAVPALVVFGESDGIAGPGYGRALAGSLPRGRFELIAEAGHLPQLEQPDALFSLIDPFIAETATA